MSVIETVEKQQSNFSFAEIIKKQQGAIRDYGMYVAFLVIVVVFTVLTKGLFVSSRNIGNLVNATSYIAVLAVGMTLVIVMRHIDPGEVDDHDSSQCSDRGR